MSQKAKHKAFLNQLNQYNIMAQLPHSQRRSEKLTSEEVKALKKHISTHPPKYLIAYTIGVSLPTLDRTLFKGTAHPDTVKKIRLFLSSHKAATA